MASNLAAAPASLDVGTLFFIAVCVTVLLGLFLLFAWTQERIRALAWWSGAYLIGGASGALWRFGDVIAPGLPPSMSTVLLFVAVGMIWSAARVFHGRPVLWIAASFGAVFWLIACFFPAFIGSAASRIVVSALIIAGYTFLTAVELRRERRKSFIRRWPAMFVPMLHGAVILFPAALASLSSASDAGHSVARGWIALFAIEILLYVVGTAFIVLILVKDRTVHIYKTAATTDPLTGLLNRRGFFEATAALMTHSRRRMAPVSVLAFDLDHFKSINDRYGHAVGDAVLQMFAKVARDTLRASDVVGRLGGEEFVAVLPSTLADAAIAAERVRAALVAASLERNGQRLAATVSIGVSSGSPTAAVDLLLTRADEALYRAKANGRNRIETDSQDVVATPETAPQAPEAAPQAANNPVRHPIRRRGRRKEMGIATNGAPQGGIALVPTSI
jgi:diguanylate cyclase (GGDEF)-like protein